MQHEPDVPRRIRGGQSRRDFLRRTGIGAGVLLGGSALLAACGDDEDEASEPAASAPVDTAGAAPAATSAAATTAAAGESSEAAASAPAEALTGSISLWAWGAGPEFDAWTERIAYFNSKYPDVEVEFEPLEKNGYEEYPQLLTRIAGGNAPDVMRVLNFQPTQLVAQGQALLPLDDFIAATPDFDQPDFFESVWKGAQVDGKVYAVPQNGEPYTLYYNADAFAAAGLEDPQAMFAAGTWDEAAFMAAIDGLMDKGGMRFGVAFESWNYDNFCFMGGGTVLDENLAPTIDQGASPQMLGVFAQLVADKKAPSPVVGGGANLEPFKNGQVGMYIMGPWWGPALEATPPAFKWNVTGLPAFNGQTSCKLEIDSLSISAASKNPEAAWAFVKTVTDTEGLRIWSKAGTPTRKSSLEAAGYSDIVWRKDSLTMVDKSTFSPFSTAGAAVDTAATAALDPMWAGQKTAEEATADAAAKIGEAIASA